MSEQPGAREDGAATYRPVAPGDLDLICRHRHEMFKASARTDAMVQPSTDAFREWLKPRLDDGVYFGWIACLDGIEIAGLGMMVIDWPPHLAAVPPRLHFERVRRTGFPRPWPGACADGRGHGRSEAAQSRIPHSARHRDGDADV